MHTHSRKFHGGGGLKLGNITRKGTLSFLLALVFLFSLVPASLAADTDTGYGDVPASYWAFDAINAWSLGDNAILEGDGSGNFYPANAIDDNSVDQIIGKILGNAKDWEKGKTITREAAVVKIAKAFSITAVENPAEKFADDADISKAAKPYVYGLKARGVLTGVGDNKFNPGGSFTRAGIVQVVYNLISRIADKDVADATIKNDLIIRKSGVTVKDTVVNGDLIVAPGVGEGDVHFENTTVKGNVYIEAGGKNSLYAADFRVEGSVIVRKYEGENKVRLVISGDSNFSAIVLETGAIIVAQELADGTKINVEIPADYLEGSEFEFIGNFDKIENNGTKSDITITGSVNNLVLNESAKVSGTGTITTATVSADAGKDTTFTTTPVSISGAGANDATLPAAAPPASSPPSGGGDYNPPYYPPSDPVEDAKNALTFDVIKGSNAAAASVKTNLALPASLTAYSGVTITWASDNAAIKVDGTSGIVTRPATGEADATVTLTATIAREGSASQTKTFALTVLAIAPPTIDVSAPDERFASGYPKVSFNDDGSLKFTVKLKPGIATEASPVIAYLTFANLTGSGYSLNKESILYGYAVSDWDNGDGKHYTWSTSIGEIVITGDGEFTYGGTITTYENIDEYNIGVVLLKNDDIDDPDATATIITLTADQIGYVDVTPPYLYESFLSKDKTKIHVYASERLSTEATNLPDPGDFKIISNYGNAVSVTVTNVEIENAPETQSSYMSGHITLTLSGALDAEESQFGTAQNYHIEYTPGTKVIADQNSNTITQAQSWIQIYTKAPTATAYINPTAGTMLVRFELGLHYWAGTYPDTNFAKLNDAVSLKYRDGAVDGFAHYNGMWSTTWTHELYTFTPLPAGRYEADEFTFSVATGLTFWNYDTIIVTDKPAEDILTVNTEGVTASYDAAYNRVVLKLPPEVVLRLNNGSTSVNALALYFELKVDGERVLFRGTSTNNGYYYIDDLGNEQWWSPKADEIILPLTPRLAAKITAGTVVTVSYIPDERFYKQPWSSHLADITGAYIPAFGPIAVTDAAKEAVAEGVLFEQALLGSETSIDVVKNTTITTDVEIPSGKLVTVGDYTASSDALITFTIAENAEVILNGYLSASYGNGKIVSNGTLTVATSSNLSISAASLTVNGALVGTDSSSSLIFSAGAVLTLGSGVDAPGLTAKTFYSYTTYNWDVDQRKWVQQPEYQY